MPDASDDTEDKSVGKFVTLGSIGLTLDEVFIILQLDQEVIGRQEPERLRAYTNAHELGHTKGIMSLKNVLFQKARDGEFQSAKFLLQILDPPRGRYYGSNAFHDVDQTSLDAEPSASDATTTGPALGGSELYRDWLVKFGAPSTDD